MLSDNIMLSDTLVSDIIMLFLENIILSDEKISNNIIVSGDVNSMLLDDMKSDVIR
jgi:hypothetical protein